MRATTVIVIDPLGRILLSKRLNTDFYQAPGGKKDDGEEDLETAARELFEETGLRTTNLFFLCQNHLISGLDGSEMDLTTFVAPFSFSELENLERKEPDKNGAWIFFEKNYALENLNLLPGLRAALQIMGEKEKI